jgi:cell pole-organizing protein PopZ
MEEILASIRQIISEDGEGPAAPQVDQKAKSVEAENRRKDAAVPQPTDETEVSAEARGEPMKPQPSEGPAKAAQANPPVNIAEASPRTEQTAPRPLRPAAAQPRPARPEAEHHLLSAESDASVSSSFSALAHTILAQNARTLEDLVTEMLRPMLRGWLDDNLPSLVERLVKEEIDRVSRGRR